MRATIKLIIVRVLQSLAVLFVVSFLTFYFLSSAGGDALSALQSNSRVSEDTLNRLRHIYGLDQSVLTRFWHWISNTFHGDLGVSFNRNEPVWTVLLPHLGRTAAMALTALIFALVISLYFGVEAARRPGGMIDRLVGVMILIGTSIPRMVAALLMLAFLARYNGLGAGGSIANLNIAQWFLRMLPPAFILSLPLTALLLAQTRANIRAGLARDFVRVARAKGLRERTILWRHVFRPSLNPLITITGYAIGQLISGSVIVEEVLGWEGLGHLSFVASKGRDVPLLMGVVLVTSTAVLCGNLIADLLLRFNDPRLQ